MVTLDALNSDSNPFTKGLNVQSLNGATIASAETLATANTKFTRYDVPGNYPYVHQSVDTPSSFTAGEKNSSCVASSTVMALAHLGKVNGNLGQKVLELYRGSAGIGPVTPGTGREGSEAALRAYGINQIGFNYTTRTPSPFHLHSLQDVVNALESNNVVILVGTGLTGGGHAILVRGYLKDGADVRLIVNDSWGNKNAGNYGRVSNGAGAVYTWEQIQSFSWAFKVNASAASTPNLNQWRGEYYPNTAFYGTPVVRGDNTINFNWGGASPVAGVPGSNFSVRWKRTASFPSSGVYRFRTTSDDGLRIFIDGRPILNQWYPHAPTQVNSDVYIAAGQRTVTVEYYQGGGGALAQVDWAYQNPGGLWEGSYYNNRSLAGAPAFVRQDGNINFSWGMGSPGVGVGSDNFSVRWNRSLYLPGGAWQFYTRSDDGSRVYLNGGLILNQWWDHAAQNAYSAYYKLEPGQKNLTVDFYENGGGASMQFSYWPRIQAEYYDQRDFRGTYKSAVLNSLDQNWLWSGPHKALWQTQDNFSTRYTWPVSLRGGDYRICIDSDDGFRFYVDGQLKISRWYDSSAQTCQTIAISAGWKTFRVEHYENGGGARVRMTWGRADGTAWYGTAQPSSNGAATYLTDDQAALAAAEPVEAETVDDYFSILHEQGTLGLGLEAEEQAANEALYQVMLPIVIR